MSVGSSIIRTRCNSLLKITNPVMKTIYSAAPATIIYPRQPYTTALSSLTKDQATELVFRLTEPERLLLQSTLKEYESNLVKTAFEGQLASSVWRSQFGRPTTAKLQSLGEVDPTGAYCEVPDDWLAAKFVEIGNRNPSKNDLMKLMIINALPFVGFGFLDNFTMIIAGDYIDHTLGMFMSISTMAAAALGNTISDVLGIGSAYYVERASEFVGVKAPKLTPAQLQLPPSRKSANIGRVLGITIGCLLGMCPLLFMEGKPKKEDGEENKTETSSESATATPAVVTLTATAETAAPAVKVVTAATAN